MWRTVYNILLWSTVNHSSTKTMPRPYTLYTIQYTVYCTVCTVSPVQFVYDCLPKVKTEC